MTDKKTTLLNVCVGTVCVLVTVTIITLSAIGFYGMIFTTPWLRKHMVEHYSDESNYIQLSGKITEVAGPYESRYWLVKISVSSSEADSFPSDRYPGWYLIPLTSYEELQANAFPWEDNETEYLFTSAWGYWWDDFNYPLISVTSPDGETVYLSFEDGKHNYLDYVENIMK